jgi:hypothetical protein
MRSSIVALAAAAVLFGLSVLSAFPGISGSTGPVVEKELLATLALEQQDEPLGMVVRDGTAWIVLRSGRGWKVPLDVSGDPVPATLADCPVRDFVLAVAGPVWLDEDGNLGGSVPPSWPRCLPGSRLEADPSGGVFSVAAEGAWHLTPVATQPRFLKDLFLFSPAQHQLFWALAWDGSAKVWALDIRNDLGQFLKRAYTFSTGFRPAGCRFGPRGPEGEVLLSSWRGTVRDLMLIGQNGRMFWKIQGPPPCCARDLAWDHQGRLLVLEREAGERTLRLNRWCFGLPQG